MKQQLKCLCKIITLQRHTSYFSTDSSYFIRFQNSVSQLILHHRNKRFSFGSQAAILPLKFITTSNFSFSFINAIFFPGIRQFPPCLTSTLVTVNWPAETLRIFPQLRKIDSILQYYCHTELLYTASDQTEHISRFSFGIFYSDPC